MNFSLAQKETISHLSTSLKVVVAASWPKWYNKYVKRVGSEVRDTRRNSLEMWPLLEVNRREKWMQSTCGGTRPWKYLRAYAFDNSKFEL